MYRVSGGQMYLSGTLLRYVYTTFLDTPWTQKHCWYVVSDCARTVRICHSPYSRGHKVAYMRQQDHRLRP